MSVKILPFSKEHACGVISLLKRNYKGMSVMSDDMLKRWMDPIWNPVWKSRINQDTHYNLGAVIMDDQQIVGYLGMISVKRRINDKDLSFASGTTWAIDDGYRIYLFKAMKLIFDNIDVILDLTAIDSVQLALKDILHFSEFDNKMYRFHPFLLIPYSFKNTIIEVKSANMIVDPTIKNEYVDHCQITQIKCLDYNRKNDHIYVFLSIRKRYVKGKFPINIARILKISKSINHYLDILKIIGYIQRNYALIVECDSHFFNEQKFPCYIAKEVSVKRYIKNNAKEPINIDYLYSEYSILSV